MERAPSATPLSSMKPHKIEIKLFFRSCSLNKVFIMFLYNMSKLPVKVAFSFLCGIANRFNTQNHQCGSWRVQPSPTSVRLLQD